MGRLAFEALVAAIEKRASPAGQTREIVLKSELIQRESVAAPRPAPGLVLRAGRADALAPEPGPMNAGHH
jgi:hypothetical protein